MNEKQLIHELYVELTTRKLALDYDEDGDRMYEVLNSWFKAFSVFRENMKKCGDSNCYSYILYDKTMTAMRPFLEAWSYEFRSWWEFHVNYKLAKCESNIHKTCIDRTDSPERSDITEFDGYNHMIKEIQGVQQELKKISIECREAVALAHAIDNGTIKKTVELLEEFAKHNLVENSLVKEVN